MTRTGTEPEFRRHRDDPKGDDASEGLSSLTCDPGAAGAAAQIAQVQCDNDGSRNGARRRQAAVVFLCIISPNKKWTKQP